MMVSSIELPKPGNSVTASSRPDWGACSPMETKMEYEFYKIEHGKIHIFDTKDKKPKHWDDKYMCGQFKITRDVEVDLNIEFIEAQSHRICKRCFKKFIKTMILPNSLFEI
jgi:hypothetical protein